MKKHSIQYRLFMIVGVCAMAFSLIGVLPASAVQDTSALASDETETPIIADGIYMFGGLADVAEQTETLQDDGQIGLHTYESATAASAQEAMADGLSRYETIVEFPTEAGAAYTVSKDEIVSLVNTFLNSHPEFFYVDKISYVSLSNGLVRRLIFTYRYDETTMDTMRAAYAAAIRQACAQVDPDRMNASQISVVIHDYLASVCDYQREAVTDSTTDMRYTAYGALVEGKAVCQGYALAYQDIMNTLGVPCTMVASDAMNHAWNLVKAGDTYFHVDVTWDDTDTQEGQAVHRNVLLSRQGILATGHNGYTVGASVTESTTNTYDQAYWKNVYTRIFYVDGGLYYLYPSNTSDVPTATANQSVDEDVLFVRKPVTEGEQNATLMRLHYAKIHVEGSDTESGDDSGSGSGSGGGESGSSGSGGSSSGGTGGSSSGEEAETPLTRSEKESAATVNARLTALFKQMKSYVRLVHDADYWYMTTAYGIYRVSMADAMAASADPASGVVSDKDKVTKEQVYRIPDMSDTDDVLYTMQGGAEDPVIDALMIDGDTLYYHVEGGSLTAVESIAMTQPAYNELYVYEKQEAPLVLNLNDKYQLHPYTIPIDQNAVFAYAVDETSGQYIAVSEDGVIQAKAYTHGTPAKVTVKIPGTSYETTLFVEVNYIPVYEENGLLMSNTNVTLEPGQEKQLSVCVRPGNATVQSVKYSIHTSSPQGVEVLKVNKDTGLVTACNPGNASVRAELVEYIPQADGTTQKKTYRVSCTFTVVIRPTAITLSASSLALETGQQHILTASVAPANVTDPQVAYASSDPNVATVSAAGEVVAVAPGTAQITAVTNAKAASGRQLTAVCQVTVTAPVQPSAPETPTTQAPVDLSVKGLTFSYGALKMALKDEETLQAFIAPSNAQNQQLVWTSSDKNVVKLTEVAGKTEAKLTAVGLGTAVIRATTKEGAYVAECIVTVTKRKISNVQVGHIGKLVYTGKSQKPALKLKYRGQTLKKNRDYKISYQNNKAIGTATIVVKGKGIYTGTRKITFEITPEMPSMTATRSGRNVAVQWKQIPQADGYQIVYALNQKYTKSKKVITVKGSAGISKTISKLPKKKVYVKIRSYKLVKGKRIYSSYGKTLMLKYKK